MATAGCRIMSAKWTAFVATVVLAGAASQAHANLVVDGDFTNNITASPGFVTYSAGATLPGGPWYVVSGSVDLIGNYWQSPSGAPGANPPNGSVDFGRISVGSISQTLTTSIGQQYQVSFDLSGNPDGNGTTATPAGNTKSLNVTAAGSSPNFTYLTGTNTHSNMQYALETFDFVATTTSTVLTFASADTPQSFYGPVIGNVAVNPVIGGEVVTPLPSTWTMLIAGFVGLGFLAYRGSEKRRLSFTAA